MKKLLFAGLILLIMILFVFGRKHDSLVGSSISNVTPTSVPNAAPVAPKTFNFDSTTDLKQELEKVNPQILDSDF